jgi:hypothetical protein
LKQYPGTFICVDPFRYTGAERLQEDDDDKHGRARNQEKDSRFTFDLAWATTLLHCCSLLVVLLCYPPFIWISLETFSQLRTELIGILSLDQVRSATEKLGAGGKWIVVGEILATHKLRNRLSSFFLLSNKNVTHDDFFPSSRYLFWFDREFAVSPCFVVPTC